MHWFTVVTYGESLGPIYIASKVFLVHFVTFDPNTKAFYRTLVDLILLILTLFADLYLYSYGFRAVTTYFKLAASILMGAGVCASFILTFAFSLALPLWSYQRDWQMYDLHMKFADFDELISEFGFYINHRGHHLFSVVLIILSMGQCVFFIAIGFDPYYLEYLGISEMFQSRWTTFAFMRVYLVMGLFSCNTILTLASLRKRFNLLNQAMCKYISTAMSTQEIQRFASLHDLLSDAIQLYNQCYALKSFVVTASGIGVVVLAWFSLIHAFMVTIDKQARQQLAGHMLYSVLYMIYVTPTMVLPCLVKSECQRSAVIVHKIICYGSHTKRTLKELRIFSQQLWHHVPKVSCRLYDYDWTLFYTMTGTVTTYLVILLQFDLQFINQEKSA